MGYFPEDLNKDKQMKRRAALGLISASTLVAACNQDTMSSAGGDDSPEVNWRLITSWPKNFPGLGAAPEKMAKMVSAMTKGKFNIKVYGAGEIAPALGVFDNVSSGAAHMGHSGAYYWKGKLAAAPFFTCVPFGMNAREMHSWIDYGGGQQLWDALYAPYNLIPLIGGNSGVQMGGWFNKAIDSIDDIKGLKMRIPGIAGEIWNRAGGTAVTLPGAELFQALEKGTIDATEWLGPANDLAFGLPQIAKYYYMPGWHEPGAMLEFTLHKPSFEALPAHYQEVLKVACRAASDDMMSFYTYANTQALQEIKANPDVKLRSFPVDVLEKLHELAQETLNDMASKDEDVRKVYESYRAFQQQAQEYHTVSEEAYYRVRSALAPVGSANPGGEPTA